MHSVILGHSQVDTIWTWGFGFTPYSIWGLVQNHALIWFIPLPCLEVWEQLYLNAFSQELKTT